MANENKPVITKLLSEKGQTHETRQHLFRAIQEKLGRPVISFYTSFRYPVGMEDQDADMLEGLLQTMDLSDGLALVISSPGGSGLAAERMINVCRSYSENDKFWAIVPGKAKSAATMVCFGAEKILMSKTSELGPIDPQIPIRSGNEPKWFSAYTLIKSYENLFDRAVKLKGGNLEPFLQQLSNYDEREIEQHRLSSKLANNIAIRALSSGMLQGDSIKDIEEKIGIFLTPEHTMAHGRPISAEEANECCLNIEVNELQSEFWQLVYELHLRTDRFVSDSVAKCVESESYSFAVGIKEN